MKVKQHNVRWGFCFASFSFEPDPANSSRGYHTHRTHSLTRSRSKALLVLSNSVFLSVSTGKDSAFTSHNKPAESLLRPIIHSVCKLVMVNTNCFSKNLGSVLEDFGKMMEGEDEIEVGEVDCGSDKPVCTKVDIHSYPTFKLFYNGGEVAKYNGTKRDIESLRNFVLEEVETASEKAQADDDKEL